MEHYRNIDKCRVCNSENLVQVLKLNDQYVGTTFVKSNDTHPMSKIKIPLTLIRCEDCTLVQLKETTDPELLYRDYYYRTSINDTMKKDLRNVVDCAIKKVDRIFDIGDCVIDIGANDMTMIQMFPDYLNRIGVEPAKNIDWSNVDKSVCIVNDYFSKEVVEKHSKAMKGKKAKIITCCACFYDMDDPNKVVEDMKDLLDKNGVIVIQVSHLLATLKDMNWYDICEEHLEYYSLESLDNLLEKHDLRIFDAETNFVNGGSLRVYVCHKGCEFHMWKYRTVRYHMILEEERKNKINDLQTFKDFDNNIQKVSSKIYNYIFDEVQKGNLVLGLGASTKGNKLLQICGIGKELIPFISDRSRIKIGLFTLGTNIELISEEVARHLNPSMFFVLPWNFKEEIVEREKEYIQNGGKLLFAIPFPYFLDQEGEHML